MRTQREDKLITYYAEVIGQLSILLTEHMEDYPSIRFREQMLAVEEAHNFVVKKLNYTVADILDGEIE